MRAYGLVTLEPHDGLAAVTPEAAESSPRCSRPRGGARRADLLRFAHEMNGSWYPWSQQPERMWTHSEPSPTPSSRGAGLGDGVGAQLRRRLFVPRRTFGAAEGTPNSPRSTPTAMAAGQL